MHSLPVVGWREWVTLPGLGIVALKAKIDTGARSSSLHVDALQEFLRDGVTWLRFEVRPGYRRGPPAVLAEAPAIDRRSVTDSGGHSGERWFIRAEVRVGELSFDAEINLTSRRNMLFPMLLGRTALAERFRVDPARSFVGGRPSRLRPEFKDEHSDFVT